MSKFKIENDIPLPPGNKYPFGELEIGQSFFASGKEGANAQPASSRYGRVHGKKFVSRSVTENGVVGRRIWRVE